MSLRRSQDKGGRTPGIQRVRVRAGAGAWPVLSVYGIKCSGVWACEAEEKPRLGLEEFRVVGGGGAGIPHSSEPVANQKAQ